MKIAVISDIHANKIFCLGDLAMAGPQPVETVDFIIKQTDWTIIQGNTDKLIVDYSSELFENMMNTFPLMAKALREDVKVLSEDQKEFLRKLPPQKELEIEGVKILLVHGSPRRNNEDILPNLPIEQVEEIIDGVNADLILCGHTHMPAGYQTNTKQTVINDGSVGRPMTEDLKSCYLILDIKDGGFEAEHRLLDYDRQKASSIMRARNFDGADGIADMLIKPSPRHV